MKIAIAGVIGRMGHSLLRVAKEFDGATVICGLAREENAASALALRQQFSLPDDFITTSDVTKAVEKADAVIDFTSPAYSLELAAAIAKAGKIHICGSTGFNQNDMNSLKSFGKSARIFQSNNTSLLVHLTAALVRDAVQTLPAEADIDIMEIHHHHKKDAPSGTAILLADAAAKGRGVSLDSVHQHITPGGDAMRQSGAITTTSLRMGDVVGEHTVYLSVMGERIEISHKALSRDIFARGAYRVALWAKDRPNGFYTMGDVVKK